MSESVKKPTKRGNYAVILEVLAAAKDAGIELTGDVTYETLTDFVNNEMVLLDKKAEQARTRAAEKKETGDALRETVFACLGPDFKIINDIVVELNNPDITPAMVTSRLKDLVAAGRAEKTMVSVPAPTEGGKARKLSAYRVAEG